MKGIGDDEEFLLLSVQCRSQSTPSSMSPTKVKLGVSLLAALLALVGTAEGGVHFASLNRTLAVTFQIEAVDSPPMVAKAGQDSLRIQWALNSSAAGKDGMYSMVKIKLCFAPPSQHDRGWRKTKPDLSLDRTCKAADIAEQMYTPSGNTVVWRVEKKVPEAVYFLRAYAINANMEEVGFGQTTNKDKTTNLFTVDAITGRHTSLDIAAGVFSAFSVVSMFSYFGFDALMAKMAGRKR